MVKTNNKSGFFVGLNAGHVVNRPEGSKWASKPVTRKGKIAKRTKVVREIVREVAGFSPFEKKLLEMFRTGVAHTEKKALRQLRHKFGSHHRAMKKRDDLQDFIAQSQRK